MAVIRQVARHPNINSEQRDYQVRNNDSFIGWEAMRRNVFHRIWTWLLPAHDERLDHVESDKLLAAQAETSKVMVRLMLTLLGFGLFCVLSLDSPDRLFLEAEVTLTVPFAGPVSFLTFMLVGPAVLLALRLYLYIYTEHWERLERAIVSSSIPKSPTVSHFQHPLLRWFSAFVLYLHVPLVLLAFSAKALAVPKWGIWLLLLTVAASAMHFWFILQRAWVGQLWQRRIVKGVLVLAVGVSSYTIVANPEQYRRPLDLFSADLQGKWLFEEELPQANFASAILRETVLNFSNLQGAEFCGAQMQKASLSGANLRDATFVDADLTGAILAGANLVNAILVSANLTDVNLVGTDLRGADLTLVDGLQQSQLNDACGDSRTVLPDGLSIPTCE